jgi:colanic acid biosynthesis glycosyl transferase WcaI
MRVSIICINYAPEQTGIAVYTTGLAQHLASHGHGVTVHTGFAYYPMWKKAGSDRARVFRKEVLKGVTLRRCYLYVPGQPRALKRMLHEATFCVSALVSYLFAPRSDLTIIVSPPLPIVIPLLLACRFKRSRSLVHVQDLQPDAAVELGMLKPGILTRSLYGMESIGYALADRISTISHGMLKAIEQKNVCLSKTFLFRNWAHDTVITPKPSSTPFRTEWGLDQQFVVLYSGNLGIKQGLGALLDTAELLLDRPTISIVIVGDGGERDALIREAQKRGLTNVKFRPLQPFERLSDLLATADVSIVPQRANVRDLVLPSKLGNILASARPVIVFADPDSDLGSIVCSGPCGFSVPPGDAHGAAKAVVALQESPALCAEFGQSARKTMEILLSERAILQEFRLRMEQWIESEKS